MTNDNGINDVVTEQELLSQVKFHLRIRDTSEHDAWLLQMINDGVRQLRNNFTLIPLVCQLQIDPTTYLARLPKGFYKLNGQNPIRTFKSDPNGANSPDWVSDGFYKGAFNDYYSAQVIGDYIQFGSDLKEFNCQISYLGLNVNAQGELEIPRIADLCVRFYAMYQFAFSEKDPAYQEYKNEYMKQRRFVRGEFANSDSQNDKGVSDGFNKFNVNPRFF